MFDRVVCVEELTNLFNVYLSKLSQVVSCLSGSLVASFAKLFTAFDSALAIAI